MTGIHTVFIAVKRLNDGLMQMGLRRDSDDFSIASEVEKRLERLSIQSYIKCLDDKRLTERDRKELRGANIVVVVATRVSYLNAAREMFADGGMGADVFAKKRIYLCAKEVGELRENGFPMEFESACFDAEVYELSEKKPVSDFVNRLRSYLAADKEERKPAMVRKILKNSCSVSPPVESAAKRMWLDRILNNWLAVSRRQHIFWLCGEHGSGKTIFIGGYCARLEHVLGKGIYYCRYSSTETQSIERIIKAIAYELSVSIQGYANVIYEFVTDERFHNKSAGELFPALLVNPFNEYPHICPAGGVLVIVIDGIDELNTDKADALTPFLEMIRNYAEVLPDFLRLIITSPALDAVNNTMKQLPVKILDLTEAEHRAQKQADAERFLRAALKKLGIEYTDRDVKQILEKAGWNFDYLHYFIEQCDAQESRRLPPLDRLPQGLTAMFQVDFGNRFADVFYNKKVKPILDILASAYEPLSVIQLSRILGINVNEAQSIIKGQLRQYLRFPNDPDQPEMVSLYNLSLKEWLIQKNHPYCIDTESGSEAIVKWFESEGSHFCQNGYLWKYGLLHVLERRENTIIEKLIEESEPDDFEKLKEALSILFLSAHQNRVSAVSELLCLYRANYHKSVRYRDILVYTYRYILKRKEGNAPGLAGICSLLREKGEEIRAELLIGEGIRCYDTAKEHFERTIRRAEEKLELGDGNIWWDTRMLGVAYNRLGNLENQQGNIDEAAVQYQKGKECFDNAMEILEKDHQLLQSYHADDEILRRDEAISNERLGDLSFQMKKFHDAAQYYDSYYKSCRSAYDAAQNLNSKWDLSVSLLRLGDAKRYLGKFTDAREKYKSALELRRDILRHMRSDCMDLICDGKGEYYREFSCPERERVSEAVMEEAPVESRDIEPIRDIALCYVRLGDLAFHLGLHEIAAFYYEIFVRLCEKNNAEIGTDATEHDFEISRKRRERIPLARAGKDG